MPVHQSAQCLNWIFVIHFNDTTHPIREPNILPPWAVFLAWQTELGEDSEGLHLQGYLQLSKKKRYNQVCELLTGEFGGKAPHVEQQKGTATEAFNYCQKPETRVKAGQVLGRMKSPGARPDLQAAVDAIVVKKRPLEEVALDNPLVALKYHRGLSFLRSTVVSSVGRQRNSFELVFLWGEPDCGKTYSTTRAWPEAYSLTDNKKGWLGTYDGQDTIIIDDFHALFPLNLLLRLCQPAPFEAEVKGSHVWVAATKVIIIANQPPEFFWSGHWNQSAWLSRMKPERRGRVIKASVGGHRRRGSYTG